MTQYKELLKKNKRQNFCGCAQNTLFTGNFRGVSGRGHHVLYIASDSRKLSRSAEKP